MLVDQSKSKIFILFLSLEMRTLATRCDGHVECLNGEDEDVICENKNLGLWIVLALLGIVLGVAVGLKCWGFRKKMRNSSKIVFMSRNTEKLMKTLETENFEENHDNPQFWKKITVLIFFYKWVLPARLRIQMSEKLYGLEVDHHGGNEVEAKICFKKNLHRGAYKIIIEDKFPGLIRRYFHNVEKLTDYLENSSLAWWFLSKVRQVVFFYLGKI